MTENNIKGATLPLISILCTVYNHEPYLRQCLDGFVMQKTNFAFEAIVHDDASTDGSAAIIREYAEKYPDIIKPIYETENQYSKKDGSLTRIMNAAIHPNAKYIAVCEGDDYWTDPCKLQVQVEYLEKHHNVTFSVHRYQVINEMTNASYLHEVETFKKKPNISEFLFDLDYYFKGSWVTQYLTCVYRRDALNKDWQQNYVYARDFHMFYHLLKQGPGVCHSFVGGVYRKNSGGIYAGQSNREKLKSEYDILTEFYSKTKEKRVKPAIYSLILGGWIANRSFCLPKNKLEWGCLFKYIPTLLFRKILHIV